MRLKCQNTLCAMVTKNQILLHEWNKKPRVAAACFVYKEGLRGKVSDQVERPEKCQLIHCGEACHKP